MNHKIFFLEIIYFYRKILTIGNYLTYNNAVKCDIYIDTTFNVLTYPTFIVRCRDMN